MRGCVAAGLASALIDAGLNNCFDEIYGSSAGALVAAYWLPNSFGMVQYECSIYYDLLTDKNSKNFIDKTRAQTLLGYESSCYFTSRFFQDVFGSRQKDLSLYACVHVCVSVYLLACLGACAHTCLCVHVCVCLCVYVRVCVFRCVCVRARVCVRVRV